MSLTNVERCLISFDRREFTLEKSPMSVLFVGSSLQISLTSFNITEFISEKPYECTDCGMFFRYV